MIGKGLESLLPKKSFAPSAPYPASAPAAPPHPPIVPSEGEVRRPAENAGKKHGHDAIFHIEVEKIKPNPYQPRHVFKDEDLEELAASIREFGVIQPLVVTKRVEETAGGTVVAYELIAGERRLLAAKRAGLPRVPAIIQQTDSRQMKLEVALIENIQRSDLSSLETARAYAKLQEEFGLTQREIGLRVGKSREVVANALRLLSLPSEALHALAEGKINESQARALLSVDDLSRRAELLQEFVAGRVASRASRGKVAVSPQSPEDMATVRALEEKLGAPVKVVRKAKGGTISITFYSDEEYRGVRARLLGEDW